MANGEDRFTQPTERDESNYNTMALSLQIVYCSLVYCTIPVMSQIPQELLYFLLHEENNHRDQGKTREFQSSSFGTRLSGVEGSGDCRVAKNGRRRCNRRVGCDFRGTRNDGRLGNAYDASRGLGLRILWRHSQDRLDRSAWEAGGSLVVNDSSECQCLVVDDSSDCVDLSLVSRHSQGDGLAIDDGGKSRLGLGKGHTFGLVTYSLGHSDGFGLGGDNVVVAHCHGESLIINNSDDLHGVSRRRGESDGNGCAGLVVAMSNGLGDRGKDSDGGCDVAFLLVDNGDLARHGDGFDTGGGGGAAGNQRDWSRKTVVFEYGEFNSRDSGNFGFDAGIGNCSQAQVGSENRRSSRHCDRVFHHKGVGGDGVGGDGSGGDGSGGDRV